MKSVHYKIKDFICDICEYRCCSSDNLKRHIKGVHLKIKDDFCPVCKEAFSTLSSLNSHIKRVHNKIKREECKKCDKLFYGKSDLKRHEKLCTGKENISAGEYKIKNVLNSLNIPFEKEVSEIKTEKSWLRFDFKITVNNYTKYIEFDGIQHYQPIQFGNMSPERAQENFEKLQLHDQLKNEWCKERGYELLRIKYTDFDSVDSLVKEFVNYSIN